MMKVGINADTDTVLQIQTSIIKRQNQNENTGHLKILIMNMIVSNQI